MYDSMMQVLFVFISLSNVSFISLYITREREKEREREWGNSRRIKTEKQTERERATKTTDKNTYHWKI
jgi:hypothetical protein